jgi:outer membrane protein insertion porin family
LAKKLRILTLLIGILICATTGYAQVVVTSNDSVPNVTIDYSNPQTYEIGGITTSGTGGLDRRLLPFQVGEQIEIPGEKISKTLKKLWETGLYEDIRISVTKIIGNTAFLDIYLEDRARLAAFAFVGAKKNEETELREKIKISQGNVVNDNMKSNCINLIRNYYIDKGYHACTVTVEERQDEKINRAVNLYFNINKGKKIKIERIAFYGNNNASDGVLLKSMKETKERFHFMPFYKADTAIAYMFRHPDYYRSKDIIDHLGDYFANRVNFRLFKGSKFIKANYESDKVKLIEKYNELGFRDAYIVKDSFYMKGNLAYIDITVDEGPRYYFRNIDFVGNTKYPTELLRQILNIEKGDVYNQKRLMENISMNQDGNDISSLYMNDGYLFFYATPTEVMVENDSIDIEIRIREGQQATYNRISVSGNTKTNDNVILREVTTLPGQLFNRADIIRSQQVLLSLGYFNQEKMDVRPTPNEADGTVDIEYVVEETSSDQLELSAGYGAAGFVLSAGVSFNNFSFKKFFKKDAWKPIPSGDGQKLALKISVSTKWYQSYNLTFVEPWLGGKKPNTLSANVYYQHQTNGYTRSNDAYAAIDIIGANLTISRKLKWPDDYFQVSHSLIYQHYRVYNYGSVFIFSNGYANNISYKFTIMRNSVNAPIYPREGSEISFSVQATPPYSLFSKTDYATATDQEKYKFLEFHKWKLSLSWYTKIVDNLVLNVRMKGGFIGWYNKTIGAPPFERFYLGGDGLSGWALDGREVIGMRGYDDEALTVRENGNYVGGTIYNKFTAELRYPITLNPSATIYVLAFVEAGNTWTNIRKYSPFNLYKSAGLGVRIYLPMFGLLGFDWGYGFDEVPGLKDAAGSRFHISINQSID